MTHTNPPGDSPEPPGNRKGASRQRPPAALLWVLICLCVVAGVATLALLKGRDTATAQPAQAPPAATAAVAGVTNPAPVAEKTPETAPVTPVEPSAAEVVSNKLSRFTRQRRDLMEGMARRATIEVPAEAGRFFEAAEAGNWEQLNSLFGALKERINTNDPAVANVRRLWSPILSVYGTFEQAQKWPPGQLLKYGNTILDALRPGMIYFGGTDEGRFIPELLNATRDENAPAVITQNALVDNAYREFLAALYTNRINTLSDEDTEKAFQSYMIDAQRRLEHDLKFPSEPKQIRPGERVQMVDNRPVVSGIVAVMAINERMLLALMEKNPERSFALQESTPLRATYREAIPLGPVVQIGVKEARKEFTKERAAEAVDYWRRTARELAADAAASNSPVVLQSYAKLATGQANLLADWQHLEQAEQAYRVASQIWPANIESMGGLAELLVRTGRRADADTLMDEFAKKFPDKEKDVERTRTRLRNVRPSVQLRK